MTLPKWLNDLLINILLPMAKLLGKNAVVQLITGLKAKDPNWYNTVIMVGYRFLVVHLKPIADDSATPWDNEAVDLIISAIAKSATDTGTPLPDVTIIPKTLPAP